MSTAFETTLVNRRSLLKRAGLLGLGLPAAGMLLNACGNDDSDAPTTLTLVSTPSPATPTGASGESVDHGHAQVETGAVTELTVTAKDLSFEPKELTAPANQPVRLTFINSGAIEHDWEVHGITVSGLTSVEQPATFNERMSGLWDEALAESMPYAAAASKEQMVIEFTPTTAGTYEMMCMVPGHAQAGMTGTFTVTEGDSDTATTPGTPETEEPFDYEAMDRMHEAGVKAFPAATAGLGGQPLEFRMEGDVKVFDLTCDIVQWEVEPGKLVEAWAYNGVVPGPEIRATEGEKVRINVTNNLKESTAVHWHGLIVPNNMDGVPFLTQPPIKPGETFVYEFPVKPAGTHMYHSHHNAAKQVSMGLLGAFIVEPQDPASRPAFDREWTMVINDGPLGFTINGKGFPATQPFVCKQGERLLIRYMNEGMMIHPMHLHGMPQLVIAKDGYLQPMPWMCDTLNIAPGERWEVIVEATELGVWAFHCHILTHAESEHGMFGMVTALIVEE